MKKKLIKPKNILNILNVDSSHIILDLGCGGSGHWTIPAAKLVEEKGVVYAVDILDKALSALKGKMKLFGVNNIIPVKGDAENHKTLRFKKHFFDIVILTNVLDQSKKYNKIVETAMHLLKPGGKLLIVNRTEEWAKMWKDKSISLKKRDFQKFLKTLPIDILDELDLGDFYYGVVIKKRN